MLLALLLLAASVDHDVLMQLLAVDTSHGHEAEALKPVLERFKAAGVPAQLLESGDGHGNLIARVKGTGAKKPLLLVAHIDVVPVEGQKWDTTPFQPVEKDGFLVARGVTDDKAMASAIVAVALELAASPQKPSRDVIVALTSGEETGGDPGVRWLVKNHRDLIDAELALNEGGDLVLAGDQSKIESVQLAVAEKTYKSFKLQTKGTGGHSSVPPMDRDPILQLSRALVKVGQYRFPAHVIPEARDQLTAASRVEPQPLGGALERAGKTGKLSGADEKLITAERVYNAAIRTTCTATQLGGAPADNVLPTSPWAAVNCRILPDESIAQTEERLRKAIGDPGVEITRMDDLGPGGRAPLQGPIPDAVRAVAHEMWGNVPVVNSLQFGSTDSKYLREIGIPSYGIDTAPVSLDDIRRGVGAHGANERASLKWLPAGTDFLRNVVKQLVR